MSNIPGSCQAEWVDDRIYEFLNKKWQLSVVSGSHCFKYPRPIKHIRVPSILPYEAKHEFNEIKSMGIDTNRKFLMFYLRIMAIISNGLKFLKFNILKGEGRVFWMFPSLLATFRLCLTNKYDFIYTTGGPVSSHLSGIFIGKLLRIKVLSELQDPLTGDDIGRNKVSRYALSKIEYFIISNATKVIYATKNAKKNAQLTYPDFSKKIDFIYPGAKKNNIITHKENKDIVNISYIGSLYQTRNLDTFLEAYEKFSSTNIILNLYGWIADDILERIEAKSLSNLKIHGMVPREKAFEAINKADILLLVQHTDSRSKMTIPFKIYDYMNSHKLILGLIYKNDEIKHLLENHGHLAAEADDIIAVEEKLNSAIQIIENNEKSVLNCDLTTDKAVNKMIELVYETI
jgi:hypothetical protein